MIAIPCQHEQRTKIGKDRKGNQRFRCTKCRKTFASDAARPLGNMRIDLDKAVMALSLLLEGMSIRATERLTSLHRDTICDLVLHVGENCERFMANLKGVPVQDIQADEIWSYVYAKDKKKIERGLADELGDSWTFIAIEANTKFVVAYAIGKRDLNTCQQFLNRLKDATVGRFQMTTDGLTMYRNNVPFTLGSRVDFGQLVKTYASTQTETRYSPAQIISAEKSATFGTPDPDRISTSYIERLNLTLRMQMRRFTRLTNGFSKSPDHHRAMQGLFFAWYNWCRKHETLKQTPAMAARLTDRNWTIADLLRSVA